LNHFIDDLINKGIEQYRMGNLDDARETFRGIIASEPERADVRSLDGVVSLGKGEFQAAVDSFNNAIELDSSIADYPFNLSLAYFNLGDLNNAERAARAALAIRAEYAEAWNTLGMIANERKNWRDAKHAFEQAVHHQGDYGIGWVNLCGVLLELGDTEGAIKSGERGLDLAPGLAQSHYNIARAYDSIGQHELSIEAFRQSIEIDPGFAAAYTSLSRSLTLCGMLQEAEEVIRKFRELFPDSLRVNLDPSISLFEGGTVNYRYLHAAKIDAFSELETSH